MLIDNLNSSAMLAKLSIDCFNQSCKKLLINEGLNMTVKKANPVGRPTLYTDEMPSDLVEYFSLIETFVFNDKEYPQIKTKAGFCARNKIASSTFDLWCEKHSEFMGAWHITKQLQANQIHNLTANRIIDGNYGKLLAVNCTSLKDKVEQTIDHKNIQINIDNSDKNM